MAQILVLDDVLDAGILIQRILQKKGHEVHVFHDEDEALRYVEKNQVDLAILDMNLRKMDGLDVLCEMQKSLPRLPAIMLTGLPKAEMAKQAFSLGAVAYCAKPIDKERLEERVAEALLEGADLPEQ
ncbi:response regulator [Thiovibrio frasassiensis]|uniref:Response regulator n=1 Tax=Thiovibrio frasassiensis TaxID=2984131 RepID=A0A9X4MNA0_9BACT|nr:response regulator [Thiovibrio frasassiensis]MDG4475787.1 response regulator [Thiovibrio frasassiensis]